MSHIGDIQSVIRLSGQNSASGSEYVSVSDQTGRQFGANNADALELSNPENIFGMIVDGAQKHFEKKDAAEYYGMNRAPAVEFYSLDRFQAPSGTNFDHRSPYNTYGSAVSYSGAGYRAVPFSPDESYRDLATHMLNNFKEGKSFSKGYLKSYDYYTSAALIGVATTNFANSINSLIKGQ